MATMQSGFRWDRSATDDDDPFKDPKTGLYPTWANVVAGVNRKNQMRTSNFAGGSTAGTSNAGGRNDNWSLTQLPFHKRLKEGVDTGIEGILQGQKDNAADFSEWLKARKTASGRNLADVDQETGAIGDYFSGKFRGDLAGARGKMAGEVGKSNAFTRGKLSGVRTNLSDLIGKLDTDLSGLETGYEGSMRGLIDTSERDYNKMRQDQARARRVQMSLPVAEGVAGINAARSATGLTGRGSLFDSAAANLKLKAGLDWMAENEAAKRADYDAILGRRAGLEDTMFGTRTGRTRDIGGLRMNLGGQERADEMYLRGLEDQRLGYLDETPDIMAERDMQLRTTGLRPQLRNALLADELLPITTRQAISRGDLSNLALAGQARSGAELDITNMPDWMKERLLTNPQMPRTPGYQPPSGGQGGGRLYPWMSRGRIGQSGRGEGVGGGGGGEIAADPWANTNPYYFDPATGGPDWSGILDVPPWQYETEPYYGPEWENVA